MSKMFALKHYKFHRFSERLEDHMAFSCLEGNRIQTQGSEVVMHSASAESSIASIGRRLNRVRTRLSICEAHLFLHFHTIRG